MGFDERCKSRVFNFKTVEEYYQFGSCAPYTSSINIPCLMLSAEDDSIAYYELVPIRECRINPNIILALTARGSLLEWFHSGWDNILGMK